MKKIMRVAAAGLVAVFVHLTPAVSAQTSCNISGTGPGSVNSCVVNTNNTVTITCTNGVRVTNDTTQTASSGLVVVSGNTGGGSGTSGNAGNVSDIVVNLATHCAQPANVPPPTTPPTTPPEAPESPEAPEVLGAAQDVQPAALPRTGVIDNLRFVGAAAVLVAAATVLARIALATYRHYNLK